MRYELKDERVSEKNMSGILSLIDWFPINDDSESIQKLEFQNEIREILNTPGSFLNG